MADLHGAGTTPGASLGGDRLRQASASARSRRARAAWRVGTLIEATTSVRLCVMPPTRKKRRRTRPATRSSSPSAQALAPRGAPVPGDGHGLGRAVRWADGELEGEHVVAGREGAELGRARSVPTRTARLTPAEVNVELDMAASDGAVHGRLRGKEPHPRCGV